MDDDFVRLATQQGDIYVRPSWVGVVRDAGPGSVVEIQSDRGQHMFIVNHSAEHVIALLRGEQPPAEPVLPKVE